MAWEQDTKIRDAYRVNKQQLLVWPSPELVGVASLKALAMNVDVIGKAIQVWGAACPKPRTMSIDWLKKEARPQTKLGESLTCGEPCLTFSLKLSVEVFSLHKLLNPTINVRSVAVYVDSWGVKRLATLALRRWKAPITALRVTQLND